MNKNTIERWILLRQSGELDAIRSRLLDRVLARDPEARRFARDVQDIAAAARTGSIVRPDPHVAAAIHARLQKSPDRRDEDALEPARTFSMWPALASACALLLIGVFVSIRTGERSDRIEPSHDVEFHAWDDGMDAELEALLEWVASAAPDETARNGGTDSDEDELIREWLALEGITI